MKRISKSRLFFLELVIDLIFFFLCAAICLTLFSRAAYMTTRSSDLGHATNLAQNAAELFRANGGNLATTAQGLHLSQDQSGYVACYDENWQPTAMDDDFSYALLLSPSTQSELPGTADVTVYRIHDGKLDSLFTLSVNSFSREVFP